MKSKNLSKQPSERYVDFTELREKLMLMHKYSKHKSRDYQDALSMVTLLIYNAKTYLREEL